MYNLNFWILLSCALPALFGIAGTSMWRIRRGEYGPPLFMLAVMVYLVRVDIIRYFTLTYGVYNLPKDNDLFNIVNSDVAFGVCQLLIFIAALNLMCYYKYRETGCIHTRKDDV